MPRIELFGISIDSLRMGEAVESLRQWTREPNDVCRYVVTPNVDHAVMFQEREDLRRAYAGAALVLADGWPIVTASRLLKRPLPERVAGSDLAPALFATVSQAAANDSQAVPRPLRVYLLGAAPGVAGRAAVRIEALWPGVEVVGTYSPPLGFERDDDENEKILSQIATAQPDVLLLGLGAPKQELWVHRHQAAIRAKVALCIGATIDFLAGEKRRAPVWIRTLRLEWLHRLLSEPKRLARRYARDARIFPRLVWQEWTRKAESQDESGKRKAESGTSLGMRLLKE